MLAQDLGNKNVLFESDCQNLVPSLEKNQPELYQWQSRSILEDVLKVLRFEPSFVIQFFPRQGNQAADLLAATTSKGVCPIGWVERPLPPLSLILKDDAKCSKISTSHIAGHPNPFDPG
ncbi:hypothetical protein QN277_024213 [Acacia crassicarpa]|uniref:RNase H type-1 domain-containing protein n=1 Tax=Acacia crassicarpa TaxID=499986 RepID=A0AAE1JBG3_9FABA|nr:hypothetical protein QN277_024213 [Acacia crassicarpa]